MRSAGRLAGPAALQALARAISPAVSLVLACTLALTAPVATATAPALAEDPRHEAPLDVDAPSAPVTVRQVSSLVSLAGSDHAVEWRWPEWARPDTQPHGVAVMQPGFTRLCRHLDGTLQALAERGLVTLCVEASMAGGHPALAEALAEVLAQGLATPGGRPMPARVLVGGHSAGAAFAVHLGAALARHAPRRLAGALLLDPVATAGFGADLAALSQAGLRPVRVISAQAGPCNAHHGAGRSGDVGAHTALRAVRDAAAAAGREVFIGVQAGPGSTHLDAEGEDTDLLAWAACRQGWPQAAHVQALRTLAAGWADDLLRGIPPSGPPGLPDALDLRPGGATFESMRRAGLIEVLR